MNTLVLAIPLLPLEEACHRAGATYDKAYRSVHWREAWRWLPLHDRCGATFDLVPVWGNPALLLLPLLAAVCLGVAARLVVAGRRRERSAA
ncbi:hypothetical protein [Sphaerisporangium fuscum]|uniref:hypothetical protein n=1 Tax=Sphaerisporangium fuscum TaxID=2835868 RepID=UPI001BDD6E56|nr:hypothetical protein [Sphaerisporangium fuscum]